MVCNMWRLTTSTRSSLDRDNAMTDSTVCDLPVGPPESPIPPDASLHTDTGRRSPSASTTMATSKQTSNRRLVAWCCRGPEPALDCAADEDDAEVEVVEEETAAKLCSVRLMRCPGCVSMTNGQSPDPSPVSSVTTLARNPDAGWPSYPARIRTFLCRRHDALSPVSTKYTCIALLLCRRRW